MKKKQRHEWEKLQYCFSWHRISIQNRFGQVHFMRCVFVFSLSFSDLQCVYCAQYGNQHALRITIFPLSSLKSLCACHVNAISVQSVGSPREFKTTAQTQPNSLSTAEQKNTIYLHGIMMNCLYELFYVNFTWSFFSLRFTQFFFCVVTCVLYANGSFWSDNFWIYIQKWNICIDTESNWNGTTFFSLYHKR